MQGIDGQENKQEVAKVFSFVKIAETLQSLSFWRKNAHNTG